MRRSRRSRGTHRRRGAAPRGLPRRSRRSSRPKRGSSRKRPAITRASIAKALMPAFRVQHVTTGQATTGQVKAHNLTVYGTPSTGFYGLTEFRYIDYEDMTNLRTAYMENMGNYLLQGLAPATVVGLNDWSRYRLKTRCSSRVANTTGTTIVVDFLRFKCLKQMLTNGTGAGFPGPRATGANADVTQAGGSPLMLAQQMYNSQAPLGLAPGGDVRQLDVPFWTQPDFRRYYKLVGKSNVTLAHGQSTEFKWSLPTVSWSLAELLELSIGGTAFYVADRTYFVVWRVRGALGAVTETANTTATTSIATCVMATSREYTIKHTPVYGDIRKKTYAFDWPQSGTQAWVNNEFGQGTVTQPEMTG